MVVGALVATLVGCQRDVGVDMVVPGADDASGESIDVAVHLPSDLLDAGQVDQAVSDAQAPCDPRCSANSCAAGEVCVIPLPIAETFVGQCLKTCAETGDCPVGQHCTTLADWILQPGRYCIADLLPTACGPPTVCDVLEMPYCDGPDSVRPYVPRSMAVCGMEHVACGDAGCWDGGCR